MKKISVYKWPIIIFSSLILLVVSLTVALQYYIEVPGCAEDIRKVLLVDNKEDREAGAYEFVTVGVQRATFAHLVYAWLTDFTDIYSAEEMTGGSSDQEFIRINQFYMETSQNMAKYQGLKRLEKILA